MKLTLQVKTRSKKEGVEKISDDTYCVRVHVPPVDGAANARIIELLSDYFKIPKSKITLETGLKSKKKIVSIDK